MAREETMKHRKAHIWLAFAVLLFNVALLAAPKKPSPKWWLPTLDVITLDPAYWNIRYSIGMPPHPTTNASGPGWFFDFPVHATSTFDDCNTTICATPDIDWVAVSCCESIHYLTVPYVGPLPSGQSLTATIDISTTGTPVFLYQTSPGNTCNTPATVRFLVQVLEGDGRPPYIMLDENARWWSNPVSLLLENTGGPVVLAAPIDPAQWSNVAGHKGDFDAETLAGFNAAMQDHNAVGFTFGGGCFHGHGTGLAAGGTARFTLTALAVQP